MSSLLGSIFGSNKDEADDQNLFKKSKALPDRPQHKPVVVPIRKKTKRDEEEEAAYAEDDNEELTKKKKTRKKQKLSRDEVSEDEDDTDDKPESKQPKNSVDEDKDSTSNEPEKKDEERTVFVGNLPLSITRKKLAALFKDKGCGPIASCRIRSVPVTGIKLPQDRAGNQRMMKKVCVNTKQIDNTLIDTVQGYVVFKNLDTVAKALELNNKLVFEDMRIRVDRDTPTVDPSRSVFVGNLPYGTKESTLQDHFQQGCLFEDGDVVGVRIVRDKETFQCKGFGYVLFSEKSLVPAALKLHQSTYMKKSIRVMVCGKRLKGKKGDTRPKYKAKPETGEQKTTVGAFRRIIGKQQKEASVTHKRKRGGEKNKNGPGTKAAAGGLSKRAALDKKVDMKVKKLEKRASKGMGKNKSR
jgi:nucleolar protein 12